jgi:hypothetical protein
LINHKKIFEYLKYEFKYSFKTNDAKKELSQIYKTTLHYGQKILIDKEKFKAK